MFVRWLGHQSGGGPRVPVVVVAGQERARSAGQVGAVEVVLAGFCVFLNVLHFLVKHDVQEVCYYAFLFSVLYV